MHVELFNITKHFGNLAANRAVSLSVGEGEVVALLGENGAGKSTLMKVLFGLLAPDEGAILINGRETVIDSPTTAMRCGLGMVFQQFNLIPALTVLDNLLLAYPKPPFWTFQGRFGRRRKQVEEVLQPLRKMAPDIDTNTQVSCLSVGQKQIIELVKVLNQNARCIILDEPTSVLTPQESQVLWSLIRELAASGRSVILITHKMEDVMACADRILVLREGRLVESLLRQECTEAELVARMMGQDTQRAPIQIPKIEDIAERPIKVSLNDVSVSLGDQRLRHIDLQLRPGEIVGLAGVSGNGQHLLADALMGLAAWQSGSLTIDDTIIQSPTQRTLGPRQIAYIPEQPAVNAVAGELSLVMNVALGHFRDLSFVPDWPPQRERTERIIRQFNVKPPLPDQPAGKLSGGNLQKLVVGRELDADPAFIIAAYPTMGLDASATQDVYRALFEKARQNASILWISEDIDDLLAYSHRIAVIHHGRIEHIFDTANTDRYAIGHAMTGSDAGLAQLMPGASSDTLSTTIAEANNA